MSDRTWIVEVEQVADGLVTLGSEHHAVTFTLSKKDWAEMGRPGRLYLSPRKEP